MPFLLSFLPLSSLRWSLYGIIAGVGIVLLAILTHSPSAKVAYAVAAEHEKGNVEKLKAALEAEKAEKLAFADALEDRKRQDKARESRNTELSARVDKLKAENDALKSARTDDSAPVFAADDGWLYRSPKAASPNRAGAAPR